MATRHFIPTIVVSGFPGIGKSFIATKVPYMVRDLESSDYHWKGTRGVFDKDENGNKIPMENWPHNYIRDIKELDKAKVYRNVMVSSHEMIREEMSKAGIKYTNVFPENTPEMKQYMLQRYKDRQNPQSFIADIDKNWEKYIASMENDKGSVMNIKLNKDSINMWSTWMLME